MRLMIGGANRYFVVDSTEALSKFGQDAWDRVICVMTTGQAWQFKPYKWNDPKILFHHGMSPSLLTQRLDTHSVCVSERLLCLAHE